MAKIKLNLPLGEGVITGKVVTFTAPCSCTETEALHINGVDYTVVDALGKCVTGKYGRWEAGAVVSVILDTEKKFAFLQNGNLMADQVNVSAEVSAAFGTENFSKRDLPSGYTQVEYIKADGNQYIDTGYVPNSNTRAVLDIEPTSAVSSGTAGIFGSRGDGDTHTVLQYTIMANTSSQYRSDYMDDANAFITVSPFLSRVLIDKNKNVTTIDGTSATNPEATGQGVYTAYIGKVNNNGTPTSGALVGKIYACKIYDDDVLVRDYVPCKNSSGTAGLYDVVNGAFYANAGSGTFAVGADYKGKVATVDEALGKLSEAVFASIPELSIPVGTTLENATWEQIEEVANAGYAPNYWKLGDKKNVSIGGTNYQVQIIGFGHDDLTSATANATKAAITFQMLDCYATTYRMNSNDTNANNGWQSCQMRSTHLPSLKALLPTELQSRIKAVNKVTSAGAKQTSTLVSSDDLFLLSENEVFGATLTVARSTQNEGAQYAYYAISGNSKLKTLGGAYKPWWLRSPYKSDSQSYLAVASSTGTLTGLATSSDYYAYTYSMGVAFAFCIGENDKTEALTPLTDALGNLIVIPNDQIVGSVKIETGSYTGTGVSGQNNTHNSLTFSFAPQLVFMLGCYRSAYIPIFGSGSSGTSCSVMAAALLTTEAKSNVGFSYGASANYGYKSADGKTFYWYKYGSTTAYADQCNDSAYTYYYLAIG